MVSATCPEIDYQPAARTRLPVVVAHVGILLVVCGYLFFYGLDSGDFYRTEGLRAIVAAEFLRSGNWTVPMLFGEPLLTKPPGMYCAIALCSLPLGRVTEWSARLPSALAATFTVFLFYFHFRRALGSQAGLIAALVLPLSLSWLDKATAAEIDMMQLAWVSASILCFLNAIELSERTGIRPGRVPGRVFFWWMLALLCVAGGFLTKWTAPGFFYLTAISLLFARGQLRLLWRREHVICALLAASICLTWIGIVAMKTGWEVFYNTVSREALMRLSPSHHHRPYPWGETLVHPFRILLATLPGSALALAALRPGFARHWNERGQRLLQALHCWIWPNLFFWSLTPEHSVRQSAPYFPAIGGLAAFALIDWHRRVAHRSPQGYFALRPKCALLTLLMAWVVVKFLFVHVAVPIRAKHRDSRAKAQALQDLVPHNAVLGVVQRKDEGIMFYYGRTVQYHADIGQLISSSKPLYCILEENEWTRLCERGCGMETLLQMRDEQGDPIVLVRFPSMSAGELVEQ